MTGQTETLYERGRRGAHESLSDMLADYSIDQLIRRADQIIKGCRAAGLPDDTVTGYRDALVEYRNGAGS